MAVISTRERWIPLDSRVTWNSSSVRDNILFPHICSCLTGSSWQQQQQQQQQEAVICQMMNLTVTIIFGWMAVTASHLTKSEFSSISIIHMFLCMPVWKFLAAKYFSFFYGKLQKHVNLYCSIMVKSRATNPRMNHVSWYCNGLNVCTGVTAVPDKWVRLKQVSSKVLWLGVHRIQNFAIRPDPDPCHERMLMFYVIIM